MRFLDDACGMGLECVFSDEIPCSLYKDLMTI